MKVPLTLTIRPYRFIWTVILVLSAGYIYGIGAVILVILANVDFK